MQLYTPPEAAEILGVKVQTLTTWRWAGTGPVFHRIGGQKKGAIRYAHRDLEAYIASARQGVSK